MSAQTLSFPVEDAEVWFSETGRIEWIEHAVRRGRSYLLPHRGVPRVIVAGESVEWELAGVLTDEDEVEAWYAASDGSGLECTVRNAFAGSWLQRQMLTNTSSAPVVIDDLITSVSPAADMFGQLGVSAFDTYGIVQPVDGQGPMLTFRLSHGAIYGYAPAGWRTGAIRLEPGRRFVLQWVIDFEVTVTHIIDNLAARTIPPTELWQDEVYPVNDADTAVLAPDPIIHDHEDGAQVLGSRRPGRFAVELRSGRGSRRVDLAWVPRLHDLLLQVSPDWLAGERASSGVPILPDSGAGLGLQYALGARLVDMPEAADEALVRHTAWLLDQDRLTGQELALLAQETLRTADPEPLGRARADLLERSEPSQGLGLAATRVCLAQLATELTPTAVLEHLHAVCQRHPVPLEPGLHADQTLEHVAPLELYSVAGLPASHGEDDSDLDDMIPIMVPTLARIVAGLGSGLPTRLVHDPRSDVSAPAVSGYLAAVLDLTPENVGSSLEDKCGRAPHELAQQARATALAHALWPLAGEPRNDHQLNQLIGWIVLGRPAAGDT